MKVCKGCNIEKNLDDMVKDKRRKDGYTNFCKKCAKLKMTKEQKIKYSNYNKKYRENNKEYFKKYNKKYKEENKEYHQEYFKEYAKKEEVKEYQKKYRENNKDTMTEYNKKYYLENSEKIKENVSKYKLNNKDKINQNVSLKKKNDPLFALRNSISKSILKSIKISGHTKKNKTTEILGCNIREFKIYIESKFENWMTWKNRGLYNGEFNYGWDIDHIIPLSSANSEEEIIRLNHYTNLQPLCSKINRNIKRNYLEY